MKTVVITTGRAVVERITGEGPSALRAFAAATLAGGATAALTYRVLRSRPDSDD